ncbi:MAG TPA: peptidylprolyl isomerase [Stellaceae bacterium]|nr:peptidylprolyl isomerase [Stellaceae bacterium]
MRPILALCLLLLLAGSAAAQETRIAAIVNDEVISLNDLANRLQLVMRSSGIEDTPQNRSRIQAQVLRSLIDEKLQMQEAKRLNITVTPEELDQAFTRIEQQNNMTKGALDAFLKGSGIPRSSLTDQLSASIAWNKLVRNRLMQDVTISDEEVTEALNQFKQEADVPQNRVSEIFLAIDAPSQEEDAKRLADRLIDQIRGGANFGAVAQQFSQSPSAAVGGDIGWVTSGQLAPEIGGAIDKMKPGEMSYPIRTPGGYYLLYLRERRKLGQPNPDDTVLSLVEVGFGVSPMATAEEQQRLTAEAQQVSNTAKSCGELAKLGRDNAPQTTREIPSIKAADLPAQVRQVALSLGIAEASKPMAIPGGIGVIMVCERKDPPGGLPTRDEITEQLGRTRLDALARRYLRDLRRGAYVDIRG